MKLHLHNKAYQCTHDLCELNMTDSQAIQESRGSLSVSTCRFEHVTSDRVGVHVQWIPSSHVLLRRRHEYEYAAKHDLLTQPVY